MNDLSESNGHDNLGFGKERSREADTSSRHTTITNVSSNCSANSTPRKVKGGARRTSKKDTEVVARSVSTKAITKSKSLSDNKEEETTFNKTKNKMSNNKETLKYAKKKENASKKETVSITKDSENTKKAIRKTKKKKDQDEKEVKAQKPKGESGEYADVSNHPMDNMPQNTETETQTPKKKVRIKESLSQKIKKANINVSDKADNKSNIKYVEKQQPDNDIHKLNVRYLLEQAMDANKGSDAKNHLALAKDQQQNNETIQAEQENTTDINNTIANECGQLRSEDGKNVKNFISDNQESKNERRLERVETDDCTSIDTSTLPPPPDELVMRIDESASIIEERFIA